MILCRELFTRYAVGGYTSFVANRAFHGLLDTDKELSYKDDLNVLANIGNMTEECFLRFLRTNVEDNHFALKIIDDDCLLEFYSPSPYFEIPIKEQGLIEYVKIRGESGFNMILTDPLDFPNISKNILTSVDAFVVDKLGCTLLTSFSFPYTASCNVAITLIKV